MKTKKPKKQDPKTIMKDKILSKFTSGRSKAIKKRKNTLLLEYKLMNKNNKFIDRRIGEKNRGMTQEDRAMARFVAQQVKIHKKKQMFNLGNDEDDPLTHRGRTLEEIEKFDNPQSDSEDDDGKLEADFVKKAHFGGGLFTKASSNENDHRSTIDQLIAESKMRKAERQQTKEETQNLTEKLDSDLKELFHVVSNTKADGKDDSQIVKPVTESYDVLVSELRFERIGKPCARTKPEDQAAIEEKKRIEKLEKELLERMKRSHEPDDDEEGGPATKKHQSADDLDDGLDLEIFDEEEDEDEDEQSEEGSDEENSEGTEAEENEKTRDTGNKISKKVLKITTETSKVPKSLNGLLLILGEQSVEEKVEVIKDLVAESRMHKGVSNKEQQIQFFSVLLEYIDSLFKSSIVEDSWHLVSKLAPVLFELTQLCGDAAAIAIFGIIKNKYDNFCQHKKLGPTPDMLIFLKLIPVLFPASDFQHAVTTPSIAFICHILSQNSCQTFDLIVKGLFTATILLEYINLSNRYCPEAISFLRNVLYVAAPAFEEACPPVRMNNKMLSLDKGENNITEENLQLSYSLIGGSVSDTTESKASIIRTAIKLLSCFHILYRDLSAAAAIFQPVITILEKLPVDIYPHCLQNEIRQLMDEIKITSEKPLNYLVAERKRPKALRLYEPNIRPIIEGRSFRTVSQAKLEKEKLVHQYKREMKGALREIRKDKNFLSRVKLSEQAKKDAERREKVKQIFGWGQSQQCELKRMERQNRFVRRKRK